MFKEYRDKDFDIEGFYLSDMIECFGTPSGVVVSNYCAQSLDTQFENKLTPPKAIDFVYDYSDYIVVFHTIDADYYENMDDESYEPDDMMEGSVDIMTKTYYENVHDVINHKESAIFADSKYYGNLAK